MTRLLTIALVPAFLLAGGCSTDPADNDPAASGAPFLRALGLPWQPATTDIAAEIGHYR